MNKLDVTKSVVRHLTRTGVATSTANIVASTRNHSDNDVVELHNKTASYVGGFAAGWMIGDFVADFAVEKVDEAAALYRKFKANN